MIFLTYPHNHTVRHNFMWSCLQLQRRLGSNEVGFHGQRCYPGDSLSQGRNQSTAFFLDKTDCEWYLTVDTDIGFEVGHVQLLIDTSLKHDAYVVSGAYRIQREYPSGRPDPDTNVIDAAWDYEKGVGFISAKPAVSGLPFKVDVVGAGMLLVHREAMERIRKRCGDQWWTCMTLPDVGRIGEDFSFCRRLARVGIHPWYNPMAKCSHMKEHWI